MSINCFYFFTQFEIFLVRSNTSDFFIGTWKLGLLWFMKLWIIISLSAGFFWHSSGNGRSDSAPLLTGRYSHLGSPIGLHWYPRKEFLFIADANGYHLHFLTRPPLISLCLGSVGMPYYFFLCGFHSYQGWGHVLVITGQWWNFLIIS